MIDTFNKDGYLLLKGLFSSEEIQSIREDAKKVFLAQLLYNKYITDIHISDEEFEKALYKLFKDDLECFVNCGKACQHLISMHRLSLDDRILKQIKLLGISSPNISTRPVMYFNSRHLATSQSYYKSPAHQDWRSMQGSLNSIVVWIPLVNIDENLGTLQIIPKSHMLGLVESQPDDWFRHVDVTNKNDFVSVNVEAGDALFFSAFLVHQSGDNITESIRWSCHFRYNDLNEETFIKRKYPNPYIYKPQQELITNDFPSLSELEKIYK
ncbi:MAG: Phytanoyl-CoA dioxygenase [Mucilaginibacter sp.]|nr:Phytanoyl-CoA dioxygenase [Mucilaginibacter sp.]